MVDSVEEQEGETKNAPKVGVKNKKLLIILAIILGVVIIAALLYFLWPRAKTETAEIVSPTPIVTVSPSVSPVKSKTAVASKTPSPVASASSADWKAYINDQYGFAMTFGDLWKNYQIVSKPSDNQYASVYLYACIPTAESGWMDEKSGMFCPFVITVVPVADQANYESGQPQDVGDFIKKSSSYAFYYSLSQASPSDGGALRDDAINIINSLVITK